MTRFRLKISKGYLSQDNWQKYVLMIDIEETLNSSGYVGYYFAYYLIANARDIKTEYVELGTQDFEYLQDLDAAKILELKSNGQLENYYAFQKERTEEIENTELACNSCMES